MAPNSEIDSGDVAESELKPLVAPQAAPRKYEIVYYNVFLFTYWHLAAIYALYLCFTAVQLKTIVFSFIVYVIAQIGVSAGLHRLWSHKSYKAKTPLQIILMLMSCVAFQMSAIDWARNHRLHHKYSDTDADPHNATRGFFFSHYGWLLTKKHPEVLKRGALLDFTELYNDPIPKFQRKYIVPLLTTFAFILPTVIPMYFWGESLNNAWHMCILRFVVNANMTSFVNSAAHRWGNRPFDKNILPSQNRILNFFLFGEGYHNYHHTFPWDYTSGELGKWNVTTMFINMFSKIGWAYDLKTVSEDVVVKRMARTGDGTDFYGNKLKHTFEDVASCVEKSN